MDADVVVREVEEVGTRSGKTRYVLRDDEGRRGVEVGEVQSFPWGDFVFFTDPDGNGWAVQAIAARE